MFKLASEWLSNRCEIAIVCDLMHDLGKLANCQAFCAKMSAALRAGGYGYGDWTALDLSLSCGSLSEQTNDF